MPVITYGKRAPFHNRLSIAAQRFDAAMRTPLFVSENATHPVKKAGVRSDPKRAEIFTHRPRAVRFVTSREHLTQHGAFEAVQTGSDTAHITADSELDNTENKENIPKSTQQKPIERISLTSRNVCSTRVAESTLKNQQTENTPEKTTKPRFTDLNQAIEGISVGQNLQAPDLQSVRPGTFFLK